MHLLLLCRTLFIWRSRICSVCRNHDPVLSSFMTYHWLWYKSNTTGATRGTETAYPFGTPEFIPVSVGFVLINLCSVLGRSLFVLLSVFIWPLYCMSSLFSASYYFFGIVNIFLYIKYNCIGDNECKTQLRIIFQWYHGGHYLLKTIDVPDMSMTIALNWYFILDVNTVMKS
jgi:hypothetical protein